MAQQNEEYDQILSECTFTDESFRNLQQKYGKDKVEQMLFYDQLVNTIAPSWECRDCIIK